MKIKVICSVIAAATLSLTLSVDGEACTNVLVTKGASADNSCMISYSADSHQLYGCLYYHPAASWGEGSMLKVNDWDSGQYLGEIPQVGHTFQTVGNMNERQVIIAETTFGGRSELWEGEGIMDYGSLIYIALQRAATAREAISVIDNLANTYGYVSRGESFSIADKDEVWIMELIGKGKFGKGIVWVARKIPDGYICAHANQARITTFPLDNPDECLYSKDVISFSRQRGYFSGKDSEFSFCDAYAPMGFGEMRACEARAWSAFNILCKGKFTYQNADGQEITKDAYDFIEYAMGYDKSKRFPLFVKPSQKVGVKALAEVMRDHFEGTPMDMTRDIGAGGNALPYRWRPMEFEVDGKVYVNERAIATQQTGFWFVAQSRGWLPDMIGGLVWFGTDDAATSYLTPVYVSTKAIPESLREGNGDMLHYSPTSAFWMCNRVANACYKAYNIMQPTVKAKIDEWENSQMNIGVKENDAKALELYNTIAAKPRRSSRNKADPMYAVKSMLTDYSLNTAADIFSQWTNLETLLLVKFIDGNVKAQNPDGSFLTNGNPGNIPDNISQPGYTEHWKEAVIKDHGEAILAK